MVGIFFSWLPAATKLSTAMRNNFTIEYCNINVEEGTLNGTEVFIDVPHATDLRSGFFKQQVRIIE